MENFTLGSEADSPDATFLLSLSPPSVVRLRFFSDMVEVLEVHNSGSSEKIPDVDSKSRSLAEKP